MVRKRGSDIGLAAIFAILVFCSFNINWGKERWKDIIKYDAFAYYSYLPATIIYKDLNFNFIDSVKAKYQLEKVPSTENFISEIEDNRVNKYYCGTALVQLPFFTAAHLLSGWFNYDQDGYSKLYQVFINLAAIFYLLIGLIFLRKFLDHLHLSENQLVMLMAAAVFGSNIFYYTIIEPGMSHIYSFAFITLFLYFSQQYFKELAVRHVMVLAVLLGIITLLRPINFVVVILLCFTAGNVNNFKAGLNNLFSNLPVLICSLFIFLAIVTIQFGYYKLTTGHWFVYSYGEEGFNFLNPHFIDILFSYKKGLFLYTPLFFIALFGGFYLIKYNTFQFLGLFGFLVLLTYLLSSWWSWWYGGSFSGRPFLEFSALFVYLLALLLKYIQQPFLRKSYITSIILLTMICQFQTYQYRKGYIHWENMTKEQYWNVFLNPKKLLR